MERKQKTAKVRKGTYLNLANGELVEFGKGGTTPPNAGGKLIRFPSLLAVIVVPFIGLAYAIWLPLTGIGAILVYIAERIKVGAEERALKKLARVEAPK